MSQVVAGSLIALVCSGLGIAEWMRGRVERGRTVTRTYVMIPQRRPVQDRLPGLDPLVVEPGAIDSAR